MSDTREKQIVPTAFSYLYLHIYLFVFVFVLHVYASVFAIHSRGTCLTPGRNKSCPRQQNIATALLHICHISMNICHIRYLPHINSLFYFHWIFAISDICQISIPFLLPTNMCYNRYLPHINFFLLLMYDCTNSLLEFLAALTLVIDWVSGSLPLLNFDMKSDFWHLTPFRHLISIMSRQKDKKAKGKKTLRQKDQRQRPKREFNIVTSGQFCTFAFFLRFFGQSLGTFAHCWCSPIFYIYINLFSANI